MIKKYKFFAFSDLEVEGEDGSETYVLNLPYGYRIRSDVLEHRKGFSSMSDLRKFARTDVVPCGCKVCRS